MSFLFTNRTFMIPRSAKLSTTIKAEILCFFFRSLHLIFYQFFHAKINFFSIWHTHTPQTILSHKQPDFLYIQMPSFSTTVVVVARIVFVGTRVASYISVEKKQEKKGERKWVYFLLFFSLLQRTFHGARGRCLAEGNKEARRNQRVLAPNKKCWIVLDFQNHLSGAFLKKIKIKI